MLKNAKLFVFPFRNSDVEILYYRLQDIFDWHRLLFFAQKKFYEHKSVLKTQKFTDF